MTEAEANTVTRGYGAHHDEDGEEEWGEQAVSWHDDETWSWALIPPDVAEGSPWRWQEPESEAPSTPDSEPHYSDTLGYVTGIAPSEPEAGPPQSPEPEPRPENAPTSPSYSPQSSPGGWPLPQPSTGGWG